MKVVTRFAPSPTGYLHIGGARTALFNYLFAKHHGGVFKLRIEDTDKARSTDDAIRAIGDGLQWLGLDWDGEALMQSTQEARHAAVAKALVEAGHAYLCYATQDEIAAFRADIPHGKFQSPWRERAAAEAPAGAAAAIRIRAPREGEMSIDDAVQGRVTIPATELDDMIILRSDGTPTYMLAVVVDDYDMGVTHIIRGDDHLTNALRQKVIYDAMGWGVPQFAHIPLIHGPDGAKLSKRHGALGVEAYREMGYLPEALRNYLLRLGWAHGDEEIISDAQAAEWFTLEGCGKSPARMDFAKMESVNAHYLREAEDARLVGLLQERPEYSALDSMQKDRLLKGMAGLKARAKTLNELAENAIFYSTDGAPKADEKAAALLAEGGAAVLNGLLPELEVLAEWSQESVEAVARAYAEATGQKLGKVAQPLRAAITGRLVSPSVFEAMEVLGKEESITRIKG